MRKILCLAILSFAIIACEEAEKNEIPNNVKIVDDFKIEKLYEPSSFERGSWVSLTTDDQGRLLACDQYGDIYRMKLTDSGMLKDENIEKIDLEIGYAQGLLYAYNSLYVMVNKWQKEPGSFTSGLYRLTDTDGDDIFDKKVLMQELNYGGEHGPHAIIKGPEGALYLVAGNHTEIPEGFKFSVPEIYAEDNVIPVIKDPRGHANHVNHPGGWIARTDSLGTEFEVVSIGFRNAYDIAFNAAGDLFTFDSDMEWDMGSPWYRPIRVCHVLEGSDFGWRTGSGKLNPYYQDNLDGIANIGQGSPTGVLFGSELNFPDRYKNGLFIMDWSFGTMYLIDLNPNGVSYTGEISEFITGKPLPLTDMVSLNGDMYFTTGGRRLESAIYKVSYVGSDPVGDVKVPTHTQVLDEIAALAKDDSEEAVDRIFDGLGSDDRVVRYASRTALEKRQGTSWYEKIEGEENPRIVINALTAAIRKGLAVNPKDVYNKLYSLNYPSFSGENLKIEYLRALQLGMVRYNNEDLAKSIFGSQLIKNYPAKSDKLNRELSKVLAVMGQKGVIEKTLTLIETANSADVDEVFIKSDVTERSGQYGDIINIIRQNNPETRKLGYLEVLSVVDNGWNENLAKAYFSSFSDVFASAGGASYKGFANKILQRALDNQPEKMRAEMKDLSGEKIMYASDADLAKLPKPKGPAHAWTTEELLALESSIEKGNIENGKKMYQAAICASCHVKDGMGKNIGPELSTLGNRFSYEDIVTAIQNPGETVSSQYAMMVITLKDSSQVMGRVLKEENDTLEVSVNAFNLNQIRKVASENILAQEESKVSQMPPGLLNRLNENEVRDLMKYLISSSK